LYESGKRPIDLVREYGISSASIYKWAREYINTGSFKAADNRTPEQNEIIALRKENQHLKMENDILKQAALIMGRKSM